MIDLEIENVMSLANAAKTLPRRRQGKKPHVSTLFRWASRGVRGVRLETIRVGGTICTSTEALQRFCNALTEPDWPPPGRTNRQRQAAIDRANRELDEAGI